MNTIRVLIADDDAAVRRVVREQLDGEDGVEIVGEAVDAARAVEAARDVRADIVLMDLSMAGATDAAARIGDRTGARVIAWSLDHHGDVIARVVEGGVAGLVTKEAGGVRDLASVVRRVMSGEIVVAAEAAPKLLGELTKMHTATLETNAALEFARESLEAQLQEVVEANATLELARDTLTQQLDELQQTYKATVHALASSVELRDAYTAGHIDRVCAYAIAMADAIDTSLTSETFLFGFALHDVGKLAIPDAVLLKPGKLTDEEFELIKTHTTLGGDWVQAIPFLRPSISLVRNHHERWDGRGYPDRLEGEQIPLVARIFTLADTLDAMTTDRPYRDAMSLDESLTDFEKCAGTQFDPMVVDLFKEVVEKADAFELLRAGIVPGRDPSRHVHG